MNSDSDHAEMLAQYIDTALRGRLGKLSEKEIEDAVRSCLEMLRYLAVRPHLAGFCHKGAVLEAAATWKHFQRVLWLCVSASLSGVAPFMLCVHLGVPMCAGQGSVSRALLPVAVPPPAAKEVGVRRAGDVW